MSYDVKQVGNRFTVRRDGKGYEVLRSEVFGWTICHGPNLDYLLVQGPDGPELAIGFRSAEDAIEALRGARCECVRCE